MNKGGIEGFVVLALAVVAGNLLSKKLLNI